MAFSKIFFYFCLSFMGGIFLSSFLRIDQVLLLSISLVSFSLIFVLWKYKKIVLLGFCLLFLLLGVVRHQAFKDKVLDLSLEEEISFVGVVVSEPDVRENNIKLTLGKIDNVEEKILITIPKYPEYKYGDKLKVDGLLTIPILFEDFNYPDYLAKDGIYYLSYNPKVKLLERDKGNFILSNIFKIKNKFREVISENLSISRASILGAVILGDKRQLTEELKSKLNLAGVRHLTAISGMHVAILTSILMSFLIGLGLWRKQAFWITLAIISLFIILTGLQTSAIRAGIMGGFFLLAKYLGRQGFSIRTVLFAAVIMLFLNPLLLVSDVGFQLSFLAVIGIILFTPILDHYLRKIPNIFQIRNVISMTLGAQVFTLPILIFNFGQVSIVSPFANILIVPLLPLIMICGFIFVLFGILLSPLAFILSIPVWVFLSYLILVVNWLSSFSFAAIFLDIFWAWFAAYYLLVIIFIWWLKKRLKNYSF
ncbi:MAG: ComEC/Rec2 family competence protein [Candidatus Nealsonbacteria bacterium]